ncbi:PTS sugar transporter subunit IIA [Clostridium perfringens]|uniref:Ascorbate-specific PTS system EIIA component n=1 Tax=Clostridium perfringens TaxID=1502 RepID=A0A6G4ZH04_CLOPF|nr:PTS sugar transporter subunit IIA [Clostridium perfringens]EJT6478075.1 PTS sugar transporter subunit IIA [Clostridium perfringens]MCC2766149.1 PTS sugar transporter subunit IIA [Clostridium perfringens]MCG4543256.1 PTS sugar transporter subunit IIA [Clostridium perfringens]MCG4546107.1 PTS sugar transporter subunit IIA [Clostridium perfringens]MCG4554804.1 PTS sugar transporter subunit IIA [Clostridium perfringens]
MNFIRDLLNENNIILKAKAFNKEEAVRLAVEPLLKDGSITEEYVKDILEKINDLGPYMAIMPGVVIAHSRPGDYVFKECISMLTLENPVEFGHEDNDPIEIIFVIGAKENTGHLDALQDLARVLINEDSVNKIKNAQNKKEIMELFM